MQNEVSFELDVEVYEVQSNFYYGYRFWPVMYGINKTHDPSKELDCYNPASTLTADVIKPLFENDTASTAKFL